MDRSGARAPEPASVYIHVPFCRHRCGYCNFTLVAGRDYLVADYLNALKVEMAKVPPTRPLETVYLGGGTPSQLAVNEFETLLELIDRHFRLADDCEFTMEANPEDLPGEIEKTIETSRVNRISLGVQSFQADRLGRLDRHHAPDQIWHAIDCSLGSVDRLSIDLIFGACGDTPEGWQQDLDLALGCGAGHVSTYELTVEKGTRFWNRQSKLEPVRADDDLAADLYEQTIETLSRAGFEHYEVSSFAKPNQQSCHNKTYWNGNPWIGLGPGAAGLVNATRYSNYRSVSRYLKEVLAGRTAIEDSQQLSPNELALDHIVFGIRQLNGIDVNRWAARHGLRLEEVVDPGTLASLIECGLLSMELNQLKLTRRGIRLGDHVCQQIMNAPV